VARLTEAIAMPVPTGIIIIAHLAAIIASEENHRLQAIQTHTEVQGVIPRLQEAASADLVHTAHQAADQHIAADLHQGVIPLAAAVVLLIPQGLQVHLHHLHHQVLVVAVVLQAVAEDKC
jgi:uncharacterized membrane protein